VSRKFPIPRSELHFKATRSGGPGGQHVNKTATRVELLWNVERSGALTDAQRGRLREKLSTRIDAEGNVRIVANATRSQTRNREDAEARLEALVAKALEVARPRRKTRPTRASVEQRLAEKRRRSTVKRERRPREDFD
jgi:ribosome-associated protein